MKDDSVQDLTMLSKANMHRFLIKESQLSLTQYFTKAI